ncbi:MAG: phospholipid carrier-dependent glycosyltransferase [Chloroflexi bacterium]|nr:phospholipid carrier-dependent glycosyltransferase [Chloroflexota bacterium]
MSSSQDPVSAADQTTIAPLRSRFLRKWWPLPFLVVILAVGAYLRFTGINWDDYSHPHPDERFLTMVESSIRLPSSIGEYFDTATSPLNPNNAGHGFFVYGTLPIFFVRYLAEQISQTVYDQVHLVGRYASASFDLLSVLLVYLIGARLYSRRVGLLASAFSALSVLLIQHAHFFVVDPFANTFILIGIYFAVRVLDSDHWINFLLFGVALGMAVASKVSTAPLALVVAISVAVRIWNASADEQKAAIKRGALGLILAALSSLFIFRIFQPYAFSGPSFFNIGLNPQWLSNLAEVRRLQSGFVDFPPGLQWAMRAPILFSLRNLVIWGLGLPLGIISWVAWGWALMRVLRNQEFRHAPLVIWTGLFFIWQSIGFVAAMRYQLPIYPTLVLLAAWGIWEGWDRMGALNLPSRRRIGQIAIAAIGILVLVITAIWAFSFVNIYRQPNTLVAASRWIYQHVPGSINFAFRDDEQLPSYETGALPRRIILIAGQGQMIDIPFQSDNSGELTFVELRAAQDRGINQSRQVIELSILEANGSSIPLAHARYEGNIGTTYVQIKFDSENPVFISTGANYLLRLTVLEGNPLELQQVLRIGLGDGVVESIDLPQQFTLVNGDSYLTQITGRSASEIDAIYLPYITLLANKPQFISLSVEVFDSFESDNLLATAEYNGVIAAQREIPLSLSLDRIIEIEPEKTYYINMNLVEGPSLSIRGSHIINETSWDLGLPMRIDGRDGFGGLYVGLNQELYWSDSVDGNQDGVPDKLDRIAYTLTKGDFLVISTNRQYGTIPRVPVRYPLTTTYYRELLGCPASSEVSKCAAQAQVGNRDYGLGYDLMAVFESNPQLANLEINDQSAEESFTVYDHPKVLIFAKQTTFSEANVRALLENVDVSNVIEVSPKELGAIPGNILLTEDDFKGQKAGGTWSDLFDRTNLINRYPVLTVVFWWLAIGLIGLLVFPLVSIAFRGLHDWGYPLARLVGMLLLSYGTWLLGNLQIAIDRSLILNVLLIIGGFSLWIAWRQRESLIAFFKENKRYILFIEILALAFFAIDLAIRIGNPDLWHPFKGGEKPMDFSYLNAVLKSTTYPPYDPWFAQGYINYYYFGFILVGIPIKLLGIVPSTAYNLVLPTLFSMLALAAFSVGHNLYLGSRASITQFIRRKAWVAGVVAAIALVLLGNLGTVRMIYEGFRDLGNSAGAGLASGPISAVQGLFATLKGDASLSYRTDNWYWNPSRAIEPAAGEAGPITEFPFFTFLYGDLHAHMINFPLTVGVILWGLAGLYAARKGMRRSWFEIGLTFFIGALLLGALRTTNTWDFPTYWTLAALAVIVAPWIREKKINLRVIISAVLGVLILLGAAYLLFQPYNLWYQQGYTAAEQWLGSQTGLGDYLTVHGVFLFIIVVWMAWETREWMANTPISALARYKKYAPFLLVAISAGILGIVVLVVQGFGAAPVAIGVLLWSGLLLFKRGLVLEKRIILFLVGTGAALTILVEYVVLLGDISRMNTVFKFYLQVWTLFSLSAAAAGMWIASEQKRWNPGWRYAWTILAGILVLSAALYPLTAAPAKMRDRMVENSAPGLDGMAFMEEATYFDIDGPMLLREDYEAIRWIQENLQGSPVIVEGNTPEYRWGSRYTIYTGLPSVLGWNWHQRQQRGFVANPSVTARARDISSFYTTSSIEDALNFLNKYDVRYVIVGQLEKQYYEFINPCWQGDDGNVICDMSGRPMGTLQPDVSAAECTALDPENADSNLRCPTNGLEKFKSMLASGHLKQAYGIGQTVIYEVTL